MFFDDDDDGRPHASCKQDRRTEVWLCLTMANVAAAATSTTCLVNGMDKKYDFIKVQNRTDSGRIRETRETFYEVVFPIPTQDDDDVCRRT